MFLGWLAINFNKHRREELHALILLHQHSPMKLTELTPHGITSRLLHGLQKKGFITETKKGFSLLSFWDVKPVEKVDMSKVGKKVPTNQLYNLWKDSFNIDVPTVDLVVKNKVHAKRLLQGRDIEYWERVIDTAVKDPFWKNSCKSSLSSLSKAGMALIGKGTNNLDNYFEQAENQS